MSLVVFIVFVITLRIVLCSKMDLPSKRILTLFVLYWYFSLFFSTFSLYDFYKPSITTLLFLILSITFFLIGFMFPKYSRSNNFTVFSIKNSVDSILESRIFILSLVLLTIYLIYLFNKFLTVILLDNLTSVRNAYFSTGEDNMYGPFFMQINYYLLKPSCFFISPIFAYSLLFKRSWKTILLLLYLAMNASLGGGRLDYFRYLIIPLVLIYFCFYLQDFKLRPKFLLKICIIFTCLFTLLSFIGAGRQGNMELNQEAFKEGASMTLEQLTTYSYGPIVAFDYAVNHDYIDKNGGLKYGKLTLSSFNEIIYYACRILGINYKNTLYDLVDLKQEAIISIAKSGLGEWWNALYTWNLFFYLDFGFLGVIFIPFFIGLIFRKTIIWLYKYRNFYSFAIVYIMFLIMILSVLDFNFTSMPMAILLMFLIYKSHNYKICFRV